MIDKETKRLIYANIANGVSPAQCSETFCISPHEVHMAFKEVARLVAAYQVERAMPFQPCQSIAVARQNRTWLLPILEQINLEELEKYRRVVSLSMRREI